MADFYHCIASEGGRHIIHEVDIGGGAIRKERYIGVRLGVSWPTQKAKGAYVVLGQPVQDRLDAFSPPLTLLDEYEYNGLSLDEFFGRLTDSYSLLSCEIIYCDTDNQSLYTAFLDYLDRHRLGYVTTIGAPYLKDFFAGISVANDWLTARKLELHKDSLTRAELRSISREDLRQEPELRFPLANALRFAIAGFRKFPARPPITIGRSFDVNHGWML